MNTITKRLLVLALCLATPAFAKEMITFERFTLPNGLRVIVHEDHKAPIVAVRVAYHVGAKDEPVGKTGFAHLFEHLMFKGSENFKGDFFQTMDDMGAADMNGVTTQDTTQYFETVPTPALERTLWIESDRMGHFVSGITAEMLKTERGVVQSEKRDREGGPMGPASGRVMSGLFPEGHPYRRSVLGSMDDLNAASVEDVRAWFRRYYGATNTTVVLAGDIDVAKARTLMEKYFSDVPAGEPLYRMDAWVPELPADVRESMRARIPQTSIQRFWPVPGPVTRDFTMLGIAARVLNGTLQDRLYGELVEKRKISTGVSAGLDNYEIASVFSMSADVKVGADPALVERILDEQLELFLKEGPTRKELSRIKDDLETFQLMGLQSVSAKADVLAGAELYTGDPSFNDRAVEWTKQATAEDIRLVANKWLRKANYQMTIRPFGEQQVAAAKFDRSVMPPVDDDLNLNLPPIQEATLSNGMKLVLAERHEVPSVSMTMIFSNAGANADLDGKLGVAGTTYSLMNNGPTTMSKAEFSERLRDLHASMGVGAGGRDATSSFAVLNKDLHPALELWEQVLRNPAFRKVDFDEWRENSLQSIENARLDPGAIAGRVLGKALYPPGHPLAPRDDQVALVKALDLSDFKRFHDEWIRPDIVKLFVVGDTTLPEITRELEKVFADWKAPAKPARTVQTIPAAPVPTQPRFLLIDWPGEEQAQILGARLVLPAMADDARMFNAANGILGGGTTARLGQRLRVEKGWSYGITSGADGGLIQQYWGLNTSVQNDKVAESVAEIVDVIKDFTKAHPGTDVELARYVKGQSRSLPGLFEDPGSVLGAMVQSDAYGKPYNWIEGAKARLNSLKVADVNRVGQEYFTPDTFTWVVVGDVSRFEQKLRDLKLGTVEVWDKEGKKIR